MRRIGVPIMALVLVACAGSAGTESTTTSQLATTTTGSGSTTTSESSSTTTEMPTSTTSTTSIIDSPDLPGEPIEFGPTAGQTVAVVGIASNDVLNLRAIPGADQAVLEGIPPLYDSLTALGETRQLPQSLWIAVEYEDEVGWVNLRYIAYLGATTDATESVLQELGTSPAAETIEGLGSIVVETFTSEDPVSEVVIADSQATGSLGEVTYDVLGLGDDSVRGVRVRVEGTPYSGGFTLHGVEMTALCARGVTDDGVCI
jgi:hypothetical protein